MGKVSSTKEKRINLVAGNNKLMRLGVMIKSQLVASFIVSYIYSFVNMQFEQNQSGILKTKE